MNDLMLPLNVMTKTQVADFAHNKAQEIMETRNAVEAYVLAKQLEALAAELVKGIKPQAEIAYSRLFDARGGRIGAAKIECVKGKPKEVWTFAPDIQIELGLIEQTIAAEEARAEAIKKTAIEMGKATKTEEPTNRGGIKITFDN